MSDTSNEWNTAVNDASDSPVATPATGSASATAAAPGAALPEKPMTTTLRLPVRYDTRRAILLLPQAYKAVRCSSNKANTTVFGDKCTVDNTDVPVPAVRDARPLRDGTGVIVNFWPERTNGGTEMGPGYEDSGYPGGQLKPREAELGIPYVEIDVTVSRDYGCGCDDSDNGGWG